MGEHLGVQADAERITSHRFECLLPGYRGWYWSVTLVRAPRMRQPTVNDVVLLPSDQAVQAPAWVPWTDRLQAGDLAVGFIATTDTDDPRLVAAWSGDDDLAGALDDAPLHPVNWEPWLARARVLSEEGRRDAAVRWYGGDHGPHSPMARSAPGKCSTCGWLLLMGGPLGQMFGVCSHLLSPSDGTVVSFDHGCGAHSEAQPIEAQARPEPLVDDLAPDAMDFGHS